MLANRSWIPLTGRAWHDSHVPVLMILAAVAVLVGVFFAATGRGGEMSYEPADHAPLDLGPVSAADVALLHPPTALWGYNVQVTNEALELIARAIRERDITIAYLQQQVADLAVPPAAAPQSAAAPEAPLPAVPRDAPPGDRYEPPSPVGQEPPVGHAAEYRGQDDPAGPAAAPAAGEQDR